MVKKLAFFFAAALVFTSVSFGQQPCVCSNVQIYQQPVPATYQVVYVTVENQHFGQPAFANSYPYNSVVRRDLTGCLVACDVTYSSCKTACKSAGSGYGACIAACELAKQTCYAGCRWWYL